ncbi:MAG: N-acetylglucosamine kinase [Marmoricola sp.]
MSPPPGPTVVVGIDAGGTSTRAVVVDTSGRRVGAARSGGANPTSHPEAEWTAALSAALSGALRQALGRAGPVEVRAVLVGLAGEGTLDESSIAVRFQEALRRETGPECAVHLAGDAEVAFAAATPEPDGTVLVAGTGATAAEIRAGSAGRVVDGHGWLLGDAGSGFWLGRAAVRAVLAEIEGHGAQTALRPLVGQALFGTAGAGRPPHQARLDLIRTVHARPPRELSLLAPLVTRCAAEGDDVAVQIGRRAVDRLIASAEAVRDPDERTPFAITGAVAVGDHFVSRLLRGELERRWPGKVVPVTDAAAGAAWLALQSLPGFDPASRVCLHQRLCAGTEGTAPR